MRTISLTTAILLMSAAGVLAVGETDGDKINSAYKKAKIKNRARLQAKRGVDTIGGKHYIYADDKDVDNAIRNQGKTNRFSIGSITLDRKSKIKEVHSYVDTKGKKTIELDTKGNKPAEVSIGHVELKDGAKVKKVTSIIEMEVNVKKK